MINVENKNNDSKKKISMQKIKKAKIISRRRLIKLKTYLLIC